MTGVVLHDVFILFTGPLSTPPLSPNRGRPTSEGRTLFTDLLVMHFYCGILIYRLFNKLFESTYIDMTCSLKSICLLLQQYVY